MKKINIKNILAGVLVFSVVLLVGCNKKEFDYQMVENSAQDITEINFYAGSDRLIADGKATLKFIVETYKDYKNSDGTTVKSLVDHTKLPEGTVKFYEETSNKEIESTYSTTTAPAGSILRFYAKVGNLKSSVKEVTVRANPSLLPKVYVDVIFHVWELNPANVAFDLSSFQPTKYEDIVAGLQIMNDIINNKVGNAPNGASANVEFRLAKTNAAGQTLEFPGYNKIIYSDEIKTNPLNPIGLGDFGGYINKNVDKYIWNPKEYLNINIIPSGSNVSLGNAMPAKQIAPILGEELIAGIAGIAANEDDYVKNFQAATLFMPYTVFRPGYERRIEMFNSIGAFYGLFTTTAYSTTRTHSDYCEDTPQFSSNFAFTLQTGIDGEKFIIENAMDDNRYPSNRSSITLDQVNRMRAVMARCPGRMNSKTQ